MNRVHRLRNRLIVGFFAATLLPLSLTVWMALNLLEQSLLLAPVRDLDDVSRSLEKVGREFYRRSRDTLKTDAAQGRLEPRRYVARDRKSWPLEITDFWDSLEPERFLLSGPDGSELDYLVRREGEVLRYTDPLGGVGMKKLSDQYARARAVVETSRTRDLRRGFSYTFLIVAASLWLVALAVMVLWAHRLSRPVRLLTEGLSKVAAGDLSARVDVQRDDEIGQAAQAFNHMAAQLQQAQERLINVTRLASWQALARKMAHEVKNSLTPIRLTMEEIATRRGQADGAFLEQAAQIVIEEVNGLERRVRAFSEFAAEPPVMPAEIDVNPMVEERVSFLKNAHPEVIYNLRLAHGPRAFADPDLINGVLTNLLENGAEAAGGGGVVLAVTAAHGDKVIIEIHDSGPGLSLQARSTLFEPTISFKKGGMGLGLSIARKSALLCGGDIQCIDSELGGAAFRIVLPTAPRVSERPAADQEIVSERR